MSLQLQVLAAGSNAYGQLANGTRDDSHTFQPCTFAREDGSLQHQLPGDAVISIACGANHTLLLLRPGKSDLPMQVWGCGDGRRGQLGPTNLNDAITRSNGVFRRIDDEILAAADIEQDAYMITSIAASWESSYVVLRPQRGHSQSRRDIIFSMGGNDFGDLGIDHPSSTSEKNHGPHRVALEAALEDYNVIGYEVTNIVAGTHHVVAMIQLVCDHGREDVLVGWGACRHGQLGADLRPLVKKQTTTLPRIIPTAGLSPGIDHEKVTSIALGNHHTILLLGSGRTCAFGSNKKGQLTGVETEDNVKNIHCTWNGTYLISERHSESREWMIRATGSNDKGQLGYFPVPEHPAGPRTVAFPFSHTTHHLVDVVCGSEHVLALLDTVDSEPTQVWAWGWNEHGNLAIPPSCPSHFPRKIWPLDGQMRATNHVLGIWAGCATSWIVESLLITCDF